MLKYGLAFIALLSCYGAGAANSEKVSIFYGKESLESATTYNFSSQSQDDDPYNFEIIHFESLSLDSDEESYDEFDDDSLDLNVDLNAIQIPEHCKIVLQAKEARAEKREQDSRKDKPYRNAYNMLLGDPDNAATLTKDERRAIFKEAQKLELKSKVSIHRAKNSAKQDDGSRRGEKNRKALKILCKNDFKERRDLQDFMQVEVTFEEEADFAEGTPSRERKAILMDKRLQDARRPKPQIIKKENTKINPPSMPRRAKAPKEPIFKAPAERATNLFHFTPAGWL